MSECIKCERCKEYNFITAGRGCECTPFTVIDEDGEEYVRYGCHPEDVALKFAEESNQDYELIGKSIEITVNGDKFTISAEPEIHYSATQHR